MTSWGGEGRRGRVSCSCLDGQGRAGLDGEVNGVRRASGEEGAGGLRKEGRHDWQGGGWLGWRDGWVIW